MANWPHDMKPIEVMNVLANRVPLPLDKVSGLPVGIEWDDDVAIAEPVYYPSKSPMKYAVDYSLTDEDGQIIEGTDHFIMKEFAWDRAKELYELSDLQGTITFREL
jgi:hypothetical protein